MKLYVPLAKQTFSAECHFLKSVVFGNTVNYKAYCSRNVIKDAKNKYKKKTLELCLHAIFVWKKRRQEDVLIYHRKQNCFQFVGRLSESSC